jgi:hypothetical protein
VNDVDYVVEIERNVKPIRLLSLSGQLLKSLRRRSRRKREDRIQRSDLLFPDHSKEFLSNVGCCSEESASVFTLEAMKMENE